MARKKYRIRAGYEGCTVVTSRPEKGRSGGGRYVLAECSQVDLKYLHDVIGYEGVEESNDEQGEGK